MTPNAAIGPSYFLKSTLTPEWVELIWEHAVIPYLAEQFLGQEERLDEFRLEILRDGTTAEALPEEG